MTNRILDVVVVDHRLDPIATELRVFVKVENLTPAVEIKGRLTGPRCAYRSTIEIAYAMSEVERGAYIEMRVVIPEPLWWEPQIPSLYHGLLQLWQDGALCHRIEISHGLRRLQLTSTGLRLNGKPFTLRGKIVEPTLSEADAQGLRANGINTLLTSVANADLQLWDRADRLGFLVVGTAEDYARFLQCRNELASHPSMFGWIFNRTDFLLGPCHEDERPMFYGLNSSAKSNLPNADFLCCHESELGWLDDVELPKIVVTKRLPEPMPARPDVIGWIETN